MPTEEFISALFCRVDGARGAEPRHPQAKLYPSEVVTLALLYALKGTGKRPSWPISSSGVISWHSWLGSARIWFRMD